MTPLTSPRSHQKACLVTPYVYAKQRGLLPFPPPGRAPKGTVLRRADTGDSSLPTGPMSMDGGTPRTSQDSHPGGLTEWVDALPSVGQWIKIRAHLGSNGESGMAPPPDPRRPGRLLQPHAFPSTRAREPILSQRSCPCGSPSW